jgi:hypothetical protein
MLVDFRRSIGTVLLVSKSTAINICELLLVRLANGAVMHFKRCKVCARATLGTEWNNSVGAPVIHSFLFRTLTFSLFHRLSLIASQSSPIPSPPAQDYCKRIKDIPAFTLTHSSTLSSTTFPSFPLRTTTTHSSREGAAPRYHTYRVLSVIS